MTHAVRITLTLCVLSVAAFAQGQLKVAVYMSGKNQADAKSQIVGIALTDALSKHANFTVTERTKDFMSTIERENMYQHSGAVDDSQIAELGKKSGVSYVCVSEVIGFSEVFADSKEYLLTARFLSVESATIVASAYRIAILEGGPAVLKTSQKLVKTLIAEFEKRDEGAQREPIAIYLADESDGGADRGVGRILQSLFIHSVIKSGRYTVSERTGSFLESLSQELGHQYSGAVDDNQLVRMGVQSGVKYIMTLKAVSEIANIRLIDVTSGDILKSTIGSMDISSIGGIEASVEGLIAKFLDTKASFSWRSGSGGGRTKSAAPRDKGGKVFRHGLAMGYVNAKDVNGGNERRGTKFNGEMNAFSLGYASARLTPPFSERMAYVGKFNFWIGSYKGTWEWENFSGKTDVSAVLGFSMPLTLQFTADLPDGVGFFAEGGFGLDFIYDPKEKFVGGDISLIVGGGAAFEVGNARIYVDPVGLSFGAFNNFSYRPSARIVFLRTLPTR